MSQFAPSFCWFTLAVCQICCLARPVDSDTSNPLWVQKWTCENSNAPVEKGGDSGKDPLPSFSNCVSLQSQQSLAFSKSLFFDECTSIASSRAAKASLWVPCAHAAVAARNLSQALRLWRSIALMVWSTEYIYIYAHCWWNSRQRNVPHTWISSAFRFIGFSFWWFLGIAFHGASHRPHLLSSLAFLAWAEYSLLLLSTASLGPVHAPSCHGKPSSMNLTHQ